MYAIAQQMVQAGGTLGDNAKKSVPGYPPGAYPSSLPFDPSMFSDPAFTLSMEQAAAAFKAKNNNAECATQTVTTTTTMTTTTPMTTTTHSTEATQTSTQIISTAQTPPPFSAPPFSAPPFSAQQTDADEK